MGLFRRKKEDDDVEPVPLLGVVEPPIQTFPDMIRHKQVQLEYSQKLMTMKTVRGPDVQG